jgi:hypothetical protein
MKKTATPLAGADVAYSARALDALDAAPEINPSA